MKSFYRVLFKKPIFVIKRHGFTLIELLVVISIIGILATLISISTTQALERGRDAKRKSDMNALKKALSLYFSDYGRYPDPGGLTSNSTQPNWLSALIPNYIKELPKDPKQASVFSPYAKDKGGFNKPQVAGAAVPPSKSNSYNMPVFVLKYFPTTDGVNIDSAITGVTSTIANERTWVNQIKTETMQALQDGSKYHGYSNPLAAPALNYSIYDEKEYLTTLPLGFRINTNPDIYRPDYMTILNNNNICDLVDNHGVREVWLFGWHYGNIEPVESNMAGPHGDWSNSEKTNDMPVCAHTYVLYNYNYDRSSNEATHDHGHQIEVVMKHFGDPLFESNFIGPFDTYGANDGSGANFHRCGWTHTPPNTGTGYDYFNTRSSWTDCNDWKLDGSGTKTNISCDQWQCNERKYHIWRWQNMPGRDNPLAGYTNWWDFIGDFDAAWDRGEKIVYDVTPPSVPTGLSANPLYSTQVTINWNVSTDDFGVAGYTIKRDGVVVGSTSTNSFVDYTVSAGQTYQYTVLATDTSQNASAESAPLTVVTNNTSAPSATGPILDSTSKFVGGGGSTYSWLHSVGNGSNRFLIVGINTHGGWPITVSSVTYNGVALTRLSLGYRDFGDLKSEFWKLKSPSTGLGTIAVNLVGTPEGFVGGASSWIDVDQVNPTGAVASNATYSTAPTINVASSAGDVVVDTLVMPYVAADPAPTAGAGQNIFWNNYTLGNTRGMGSSKNASAGSTVMTWNTKNEAYSMLGVALKFGAPPPIVVVPPPTPTPTPSPPPVAGCPAQDNVYCYTVTVFGNGFTLWGKLENVNDKQIWNVPEAVCRETPPDAAHYNYCVGSN